MELAEIGRSSRSSFHEHTSSSFTNALDAEYIEENHDEVELLWATIERLPTNRRLRISLFDHKLLKDGKEEEGKTMIDLVWNCQLWKSDIGIGLELPTMEVRYQNWSVEAECEVVHGKPLPTLWNTVKNMFFVGAVLFPFFRFRCVDICAQTDPFKQLHKFTFIQVTLLLGPPVCGKTTLLQALTGKLNQSLKVKGEISYNVYKLNEFVPQKTSDFVSREMIIGPTRALFMDEISNGLDSSTTCQIVTCLQQLAHITYSTILTSLLQVAPETFNLFDDIILMAEGKIVYHGPRSNVLEFFEHCGFKCPPRKLVAGFLQEVVFSFDRAIQRFVNKLTYLGASVVQLVVIAVITMTVFIQLSLIVSRLIVVYKQRDFYFYPAWACSIPSALLRVPISMLDAFLLTAITYYVIGYSPEPERFFRQFLLLFLVHPVSISLFRMIASLVGNPSVAASSGLFSLLVIFLFGGFLFLQSYAEIGASVNEMLSPRWQKISSSDTTLGLQVLNKRGLNFSGRSRTVIAREQLSHRKRKENLTNATGRKELHTVDIQESAAKTKNTGMVLPFEPITLTFENVQYFVDTSKWGWKNNIMDVLSGRKTGCIIEGEIRVGAYPKVQETCARVSGYSEVLQLIELDEIKDALVDIPGISGLSMACLFWFIYQWVHLQLILMKRGGQIIYSRDLGQHCSKLIKYFEGISRVPKIKDNYNPATWMLEITSPSTEALRGLDFALSIKSLIYSALFTLGQSRANPLQRRNRVKSCDQIGLEFGYPLDRNEEQDIHNILGCMFIFMQIMGIGNCNSVLPFIVSERTVVYRERFAGIYTSWAYSIAQVIIEIPYMLLQAVLFSAIT
ncbi:hypothetical protein Pint_00783 [Pistacia integerrima]|uniref:Uncharacterized protein n=1 Tax=Pistacia integerrima TaxID=434235 RepID=A0ACC0ZJ78_9ROSI|nr:hypothetical protein Pint_00783 [Pistacia integerrima]